MKSGKGLCVKLIKNKIGIDENSSRVDSRSASIYIFLWNSWQRKKNPLIYIYNLLPTHEKYSFRPRKVGCKTGREQCLLDAMNYIKGMHVWFSIQ